MNLTVVTGPPFAGKRAHVAAHADPDALVVDLPRVAHSLGLHDPQDFEWRSHHEGVLLTAATHLTLMQCIDTGAIDGQVWLIDPQPTAAHLVIYRRRWARQINLDPGRQACTRMAARLPDAGRRRLAHQRIDRWFTTAPPELRRAASLFLEHDPRYDGEHGETPVAVVGRVR